MSSLSILQLELTNFVRLESLSLSKGDTSYLEPSVSNVTSPLNDAHESPSKILPLGILVFSIKILGCLCLKSEDGGECLESPWVL